MFILNFAFNVNKSYGVNNDLNVLYITNFCVESSLIANHFNQTPFNINSKFDRNKIDRCLDFKKKSFTKFKRDYISDLQNNRPNFEIINDKLSKIRI